VLKSGYLFTLVAEPGSTRCCRRRTCTASDSVTAYFAFADPQVYRTTGRRNFATDRRAVIYFRSDAVNRAAWAARTPSTSPGPPQPKATLFRRVEIRTKIARNCTRRRTASIRPITEAVQQTS
jgi:hypothetical protein